MRLIHAKKRKRILIFCQTDMNKKCIFFHSYYGWMMFGARSNLNLKRVGDTNTHTRDFILFFHSGQAAIHRRLNCESIRCHLLVIKIYIVIDLYSLVVRVDVTNLIKFALNPIFAAAYNSFCEWHLLSFNRFLICLMEECWRKTGCNNEYVILGWIFIFIKSAVEMWVFSSWNSKISIWLYFGFANMFSCVRVYAKHRKLYAISSINIEAMPIWIIQKFFAWVGNVEKKSTKKKLDEKRNKNGVEWVGMDPNFEFIMNSRMMILTMIISLPFSYSLLPSSEHIQETSP